MTTTPTPSAPLVIWPAEPAWYDALVSLVDTCNNYQLDDSHRPGLSLALESLLRYDTLSHEDVARALSQNLPVDVVPSPT